MKNLGWILFWIGVAIAAAVGPAAAQDEVDDVNGQVWIDYHSHYYRSEKTELYADAGFRTVTGSLDWNQFYARPSLRFHRYKAFDVYAGVGGFYTLQPQVGDVFELRPWQGLKFRWPVLKNIFFSHYFRLEQRITFSDGSSDFGMRFRYKLGTRLPIKKALYYELFDPIFVPLSVEFFSDIGPRVDTFFGSRARFDAGLGYIPNDNWVYELHLIAQVSRSGLDDSFDTTEWILRFQIKHLFASKDYRKRQVDLPE